MRLQAWLIALTGAALVVHGEAAVWCPSAFADDVELTSAYPTPYGDYANLTIDDAVTVGKKTAAVGAATINGNLAIIGAEDISVWGQLIVDPSAIVPDPTRPGFLRADPSQPATLRVENDATAPACSYYNCDTHWVSIGKTSGTAQTELEVAGPIYAGSFRAADAPIDQTLFLETITDATTVPPRTWGQLRAQDPAGWPGPGSILRIGAQKKIVLNRNSQGKVLVGTNTVPVACAAPNVRFCVVGTTDMNDMAATSSRALKRDIEPFSSSDYAQAAAWLTRSDAIYFRYNEDPSDRPLRLGLAAEQAPPEILGEDGKSVEFAQLLGYLYAGVKYLHEQNRMLEKEITRLESELAAP